MKLRSFALKMLGVIGIKEMDITEEGINSVIATLHMNQIPVMYRIIIGVIASGVVGYLDAKTGGETDVNVL